MSKSFYKKGLLHLNSRPLKWPIKRQTLRNPAAKSTINKNLALMLLKPFLTEKGNFKDGFKKKCVGGTHF